MRWLIVMLVGVLVVSDIFSLDLSLAPGLSVKNAMLYVVAITLFFRIVLSGEVRIELPDVHAFFAVWIGYALLTCLTAALVIHYPGYHLIPSVIALKNLLIDPAVFCLAVFYATRTREDVRLIVMGLAGAICLSSVATLADVAGLMHIGIYIGEDGVEQGRVFGVFGHANETGTLIACLLPAMFAVTLSHRGTLRALWVAGTLASFAVLIMTISRGAFVGLGVGLLWGGYLCRRHISLQRMMLWAFVGIGAILVTMLIAGIIDPYFRGILAERLLGQSRSVSLWDASSGRTGLWSRILDTMMDAPASLVLGFGWNVYSTMAFELPTHNHWLDLWFNLGIPGLAMFALIMRRGIVEGLRAIPLAGKEDRPMYIAFVFGILTLLVAILFTNLFRPWPYVWMYLGVMMRGALIEQEGAARVPRVARTGAPVVAAKTVGASLAPVGVAAARAGARLRPPRAAPRPGRGTTPPLERPIPPGLRPISPRRG
jgi:hypothetical protein